jgi:molybdenum cofactor synthesis domain-containing protein
MEVRMRGFASYTRFRDALELVLSRVKPLGSESVPFERALGRVLAEDVVSEKDVPPFDRSAVDGYAVQATDTFGASESRPKRLRVVGSTKTGAAARSRVRKGEAVVVMTGAPMPKSADAVAMAEHTKIEGEHIAVLLPLTPGKNVSARGEDVRAGDTVLKRGQLLRPQDIGMLASIGHLRVNVFRRPRIAIIVTGPELRRPGAQLRPGQITDINRYSLSAGVVSCGGIANPLNITPDSARALRRAMKEAHGKNDIILISGGSSVGEDDVAPYIVADLGELLFHGVTLRPGGPTAFGVVDGKPVFCLAGFPVASLTAFHMLVRPAILAMLGLPPDWGRLRVRAKLARKVASSLGRLDVVRTRVRSEGGELIAEPIRVTGSGILSSMTRADGFILVPEEVEGFERGTTVEVELFNQAPAPGVDVHV